MRAWLRGDVDPTISHLTDIEQGGFSEQLSSVCHGNQHPSGLLTSLNFPEHLVLTQEQPGQSKCHCIMCFCLYTREQLPRGRAG